MNGVLLDLGFIQIYWYSICIVLGMIVGMCLVYREASKRGISENEMTDIIFYTILFAIIGARLYYVIFDWSKYSNNLLEIFEIWHGGLAIHGAIIFGGLFLILHTKRRKLDTLKILDICAIGLIIGQAIGRWGNFFNQEVYGTAVTADFLRSLFLPNFIVEGMNVGGVYHHPLFLYESLWCVLGFLVLLIYKRRKYTKTGQLFGIYCMWYSIGRFFLEGMRVEEYNLMLGSFKVAQIVSILMFVTGLFFFVRRFRTSRFEHLYNDNRLKEKEDDRIPIQSSTGENVIVVEGSAPENKEVVEVPKEMEDFSFQSAPIVNNVEEPVSTEPVQQEVVTEPAVINEVEEQIITTEPMITNEVVQPVIENEPVVGEIPIPQIISTEPVSQMMNNDFVPQETMTEQPMDIPNQPMFNPDPAALPSFFDQPMVGPMDNSQQEMPPMNNNDGPHGKFFD